jgi:hypothetical protein
VNEDELAEALEALAELLEGSGWTYQASWLRARAGTIRGADKQETIEAARDVLGHLAGMGSLSDLPLRDSPRGTRAEARREQWDLIDKIDALARELIHDRA